MYEDLKGKRLLVIGSAACDVGIINVAHELGMYVISVDGISDYHYAPAKLVADEAWDIDYSDTDAVVKKCLVSRIDGVMAAYSEFRVLAACRIADMLGLPFYATEEQIKLTRNKRIFKDTCVKYGVKIPKDFCFTYPVAQMDKQKIEYPVIVKPADYGGRKGITVCESAAQIDVAIEYAASKSESKTLIIEEYLKGTEFSAIYTIADGVISLSCVNEKYITDDQERVTGLCEFVLTPASFMEQFIQEADTPLKNFLAGIGAENGVAFFQGMYTQKGIYVFEMGYRVNGNNDFKAIDRNNGINFMKMLINYSVHGTMGTGIEKDNPHFPYYTATVPINLHAGTIAKLDYEALKKNSGIYEINCFVKEGDVIHEDGSTHQKAMLLRMAGKSMEEVRALFDYAIDSVTIENQSGESMIFKKFDFSRIEHGIIA